MHASRSVCGLLVLAVILVCGGCSRERQEWRSAEAADTLEAYDAFLAKHPEGELAAKARERVSQLTEERDWRSAADADTIGAYRQFLARHPNGKWAQEARVRVENFTLADDPFEAVIVPPAAAGATARPGEAAAVESPTRGPSPAPAAPAPARPSSAPPQQAPAAGREAPAVRAGRFGIQLGAFSDEARARAQWQRLAARFPAELGALAPPRYVRARTSAGALVRLQAGELEEARARDLCARLRRHGQACVVALPDQR